MTIKEKILARGYWLVIIRPSIFKKDRLSNISDLYPILQKNVVSFRGWDFPHLNLKEPYVISTDWIGEDFQWEHHLSSWRFYQSGLFIHFTGMRVDWRDESNIWTADEDWEPGQLFGIGDAIYQNTEIIELAARLAMSGAGDNSMFIKTEICNINGRKLYMDDRRRLGFMHEYKSQINKFPFQKEYKKSDLISDSRNIAVNISVEQFKRFGWQIDFDQIKSLQEEIVKN